MVKITIVTPSYNQGQFLAETIESVITQKGDFYIDYVIMDGGSCDQSVEIIKKYKTLLLDNCDVRIIDGLKYFISSDPNFLYNQSAGISFRWVSEKDEGQTDAINKGLKMAHGNIFGWLNSDDVYYPFVFQKIININWTIYDFCYGKGMWTSRVGKNLCLYPTIQPNKYSLYNRCTICQPTVFFRRDVYESLGALDQHYYCSFDYEYWLRAIFAGCKFYYINSLIAKSRMYGQNKSISNLEAVRNERQQLEGKYYKKRQIKKFKYFYHSIIVEHITTHRENRLLMELHKPDKRKLEEDTIKVLYDISALGKRGFFERVRKGIFTVIENVIIGLSNTKECQLTLHSNQHNDFQCFEYLKSKPLLETYSLVKPGYFSLYFDTHFHCLNNVLKRTNLPVSKNLLKIIRGLVYLGKKTYVRMGGFTIDKEALNDIDIYHSSHYHVPEQARKNRSVKVFQTVYDLIPIIFPHFFRANEGNLIRNVIQNITNEDKLIRNAIKNIKYDDFVLCVSESTRNDLCNHSPYVDPDKVFVTYPAASDVFKENSNPEIINAIRNKYSIPIHSPYYLSVCSLETRKNIYHVVRCFTELVEAQRIKELYLVLTGRIGRGFDKFFNELSNISSTKDKIILTGYVPDEDLSVLYSDALAFVYPSFYEGFGMSVLEAMKCGAPVITSNTSSLPEVVGNAGIMLDPSDSDGLIQSLLDQYSKPSLLKEMSSKSILQAQKFSWGKCISEIMAAYKIAQE